MTTRLNGTDWTGHSVRHRIVGPVPVVVNAACSRSRPLRRTLWKPGLTALRTPVRFAIPKFAECCQDCCQFEMLGNIDLPKIILKSLDTLVGPGGVHSCCDFNHLICPAGPNNATARKRQFRILSSRCVRTGANQKQVQHTFGRVFAGRTGIVGTERAQRPHKSRHSADAALTALPSIIFDFATSAETARCAACCGVRSAQKSAQSLSFGTCSFPCRFIDQICWGCCRHSTLSDLPETYAPTGAL